MIDFLVDALKKDFAPFLARLWDSIFLWRTIGLLAAVTVIAGWTFRTRIRDFLLQTSQITHDADIFEKSDAIMTETLLRNCLTSLWNANQYRLEDSTRLYSFAEFFERAGNQYLSRRLARRLRIVIKALDDLLEFTSKHLFPEGEPVPDRCVLEPELKVTDNAAYHRYADELAAKVKVLDTRYREYRLTVKRHLLK